MKGGERLIIRSCEIVGYDSGFLYDDHLPASEPEGRGKTYQHIPFHWDTQRSKEALSADCSVPHRGRFWLRLQAKSDFIDIELGVRNELPGPMGNIDWHFCVVGLESRSFGDPGRGRTYLFDGKRLRTLADLSGGPKMELFKVQGAHGFIPVGHEMLPVDPVEAKASVVIVESPDKEHTAALGFEQSDTIYGDPIGNKCFHADPYFGRLEKGGEETVRRGKLYLMEGTARDAFDRYNNEFGEHSG
jgi:hypothetical protein